MHDIKKLPKWAQERIMDAEAGSPVTNVGAEISHCHIENNAVKHDENSAQAIVAVAEALGKNADALGELARSLSGRGLNVQFGNGINLTDVRAK